MTSTTLEWKSDQTLAIGKGATVQQFVASLGSDKLEISVAPWGEGQLKVNGREIAHVDYAKDRRQAFRELDLIAGRYLSGDFVTTDKERRPSKIPSVKAKLLEGKKGLIVGIANENSIAWGCAKAFRALGSELAITYLNDKAKKYARRHPLRHAAARALRRHGYLPRVLRSLQTTKDEVDTLAESMVKAREFFA